MISVNVHKHNKHKYYKFFVIFGLQSVATNDLSSASDYIKSNYRTGLLVLQI